MDKKKETKDKNEKDVEIDELDDQIGAWCAAPQGNEDDKSAADLEIDAWCDNLSTEEELKKKKR